MEDETRILEKIALDVAMEVTKNTRKIQKKSGKKSECSDPMYSLDEKVLAFDGTWMYYATVLRVERTKNNTERYDIHYEGWPDTDDEIVASDHLMKISDEVQAIKAQIESINSTSVAEECIMKPPVKYFPNEKVDIYYNGDLYRSMILEVDERINTNTLYKVRYVGWSYDYDEWLDSKRIFKITAICDEIKKKLKRCGTVVQNKISKSKPSTKNKGTALKKPDADISKGEVHSKNDFLGDYLAKNLIIEEPIFNKSIDENIIVDTEFMKYCSKRSLSKKYAKTQANIKKLEAVNKEMELDQIHHCCTKCRNHYKPPSLPSETVELEKKKCTCAALNGNARKELLKENKYICKKTMYQKLLEAKELVKEFETEQEELKSAQNIQHCQKCRQKYSAFRK